eukprot:CAMPEP_0114548720 /NCGR_PEP_ID=MMETSP0114-20121206/5138_1 /TAXON_ID=31324 /ORGANISM="Goniomonas sp, Strain m" /LENGTH=638 /DNA_ID=CAMNT_0001733341 /DNA_START=18 /DNA_END=1934 /DNA_ORIENTATION=-
MSTAPTEDPSPLMAGPLSMRGNWKMGDWSLKYFCLGWFQDNVHELDEGQDEKHLEIRYWKSEAAFTANEKCRGFVDAAAVTQIFVHPIRTFASKPRGPKENVLELVSDDGVTFLAALSSDALDQWTNALKEVKPEAFEAAPPSPVAAKRTTKARPPTVQISRPRTPADGQQPNLASEPRTSSPGAGGPGGWASRSSVAKLMATQPDQFLSVAFDPLQTAFRRVMTCLAELTEEMATMRKENQMLRNQSDELANAVALAQEEARQQQAMINFRKDALNRLNKLEAQAREMKGFPLELQKVSESVTRLQRETKELGATTHESGGTLNRMKADMLAAQKEHTELSETLLKNMADLEKKLKGKSDTEAVEKVKKRFQELADTTTALHEDVRKTADLSQGQLASFQQELDSKAGLKEVQYKMSREELGEIVESFQNRVWQELTRHAKILGTARVDMDQILNILLDKRESGALSTKCLACNKLAPIDIFAAVPSMTSQLGNKLVETGDDGNQYFVSQAKFPSNTTGGSKYRPDLVNIMAGLAPTSARSREEGTSLAYDRTRAIMREGYGSPPPTSSSPRGASPGRSPRGFRRNLSSPRPESPRLPKGAPVELEGKFPSRRKAARSLARPKSRERVRGCATVSDD